MGLKDLKSNLDIHGGNQAGLIGGNPGGMVSNPSSPFDGGAYKATGPDVGVNNNDYDNYRDSGANDDPFEYKKNSATNGIYPSTDDHLVSMLERRKTKSRNEVPLGPPTNYNLPMEYVDATGNSGGSGQGTLNSVPSLNNNTPNTFGDSISTPKKTVNGEDLHVALLDKTYTNTSPYLGLGANPAYSYGAGQPTSVYPTINPSPVARDTPNFQDMNGANGPLFDQFRNIRGNASAEPMQSAGGLDTIAEKGLEGLYTSTINPTNNYNSNWPTPSRQTPDLDINGGTPGKYIDTLPQ